MKYTNFKIKWPVIGNDHAVNFLEKVIAKDNASGVYIFNGPDDLGKTTAAVFFAQILLCQKNTTDNQIPCGTCSSCRSFKTKTDENGEQAEMSSAYSDFFVIKREKDKKNISIEQVRDFIRRLSMSSFLNSYKIGIIKHAEHLSIEAANALLKTLEEPKEKVIIILATNDMDALPSTIVSRSQILNFHTVSIDIVYEYLINEHKVTRSEARDYSRLSLGRPALAVKFIENKDFLEKYLNKVNTFLEFSEQDINSRFSAIEKLLGAKSTGQESAKNAKRVIEVWQGVLRDWLLNFFYHEDLIQHTMVLGKVKETGRNFSLPRLLKISSALRNAEICLSANVNPKLVLESIAINID